MGTLSVAATDGELEYSLNHDGRTYTVTGIGSFTGSDLIIPETYNGKRVTNIGSYAFFRCENLTSVYLPESIVDVGPQAFYHCSNLAQLTLSNGLQEIYAEAFAHCGSLQTVSLPDSLENIGRGAFRYCRNITNIVIPNNVITIGTKAFEYCTWLNSVTIGEGVTRIGTDAFWGCRELLSVKFSDSVRIIESQAFQSCESLTSIEFGKNLQKIGFAAFRDCENLISVSIPESIIIIDDEAFSGCDNLIDASYASNRETWDTKVTCGEKNEALLNALCFENEDQEKTENDNLENEAGDNGDVGDDALTIVDGFAVFSDISSLSVKKGGEITIGVSAYTNGKIVEDVSRITFSIDNSNIAKRSKVSSLNNQFFYVTLEGNDIGTTYITFSDSNTGYVARVPITVFQDHLHSYTLGAVPTQNIDKYESNFYNVNGLFVDNYTYAVQADGRANVSFDVYNTNYIYGMVEIYDSNGQLKDAVMIDKVKNNATSIKGAVWDNFWCLARDIVDGDLLTYRQESGYSKKTSISVTIPKDGYIKITNDPQTSGLVSLVNGVDLTMQISSLNKKVSNYDPNDSGFVTELTKKIVNEKIKTEAISKSQDLVKELNKNIATNVSKSSDALGNFINTFTKNLNALNFDKIVIETCSDMGVGMAENVFTYFAGPIGKVLEASFTGIEFGNMTLQFCHFMQYSNVGAIVIQNQGGGVRSAEEIRIESSNDFDEDVALDVYKVEPSLDFLKELKQNYSDLYNEYRQGLTYTYNITLVKNGTETQPDGEVDVYIPIPQNLRNISYSGNVKVYRIEEDNTLTEMDAKISGDCLVFKTTHFSLYTIVAETDTDEPISDVLDYSYTMLDDNFIAITKYNGTDSKIAIPSVIDGYVVTQISSYCFANNSNIQYVELPNGMIALGDKAFSGCTNLKSIYIYNNIEDIGNSALENCRSLKTIYYGGTETEWNNINVYPNNDCLSDISIVFESLSSNIDLELPAENSDNSMSNPSKNTNDDSANSDDGENNITTIVIICICLIVLVAGGGLVYFCIKKKK